MLPLLVSVGLSSLLVGLSWLVNEKNASTLLSGYNLLSAEDRAKFPLKAYLSYTRRGMVWVSVAYISAELLLWISQSTYHFSGVLVLLVGLALFIWLQGRKFDAGKPVKYGLLAGLLVMLAVIIAAAGSYMQTDNHLIISAETIEISGSYGLVLPTKLLESWALSDTLPALRMRRHGYSDGTLLKGIFTTESREKVRLFVRRGNGPYLYLRFSNGEQIWFGLAGELSQAAFEQLEALQSQKPF
jgi:hypothetical protein